MTIPNYGQRDPRWSEVKINNTDSTLGKYGCLVTSLGLIFGKNPAEMNDYLISLGAYKGDLVWWVKVPHFIWRFDCPNVIAPIDEIRNHLLGGEQVILSVHLGSANPYKPNHWVLLLDENWTIYDPWTGDTVNLAARYGPIEKSILGGAYLNVPVVPVSEYPKTVTTTANVNVRADRNTTSAIYRKLKNGALVTVYGLVEGEAINNNNGWYDTHDGFIAAAYTK